MFYLILYLAKLINFIINLFNIGAGFTWPGHVALELYPSLLNDERLSFEKGVVLISGTNGKTTTAKLLTHLLRESDVRVTHNKTGANLLNGIVSAILLDMNFLGRHGSDMGVFEVDENNLPLVLANFPPNVLILLNLSRDQLDRYGEVDIILEKWMEAIKKIESSAEIVLDSTQKYFKGVGDIFSGEVTYFDDDRNFLKHTSLIGSFNAKNVNAAVYASMLLGVAENDIKAGLESFDYAYGRGELIEYGGKSFRILLAKNPASFNNNLDAVLVGEIDSEDLLFILNDNIPDGRDVSWIYDIKPEKLNKACKGRKIYVSGTRGIDMAVRLKYCGADVKEENVYKGIEEVIDTLQKSSHDGEILVLPNYSAMLATRKVLTGRAIL